MECGFLLWNCTVCLVARHWSFNLCSWWSVGFYCGIVQFVWWLDIGSLISVAGGVWVLTVESGSVHIYFKQCLAGRYFVLAVSGMHRLFVVALCVFSGMLRGCVLEV